MRTADRLRAILDEFPDASVPVLEDSELQIFRTLRTQGERAVKGRLISRHRFEVRRRPMGTDLVMEIEGRHAMAVAQQLAKRFQIVEDVGSVEITRTKHGVVFALRARSKDEGDRQG